MSPAQLKKLIIITLAGTTFLLVGRFFSTSRSANLTDVSVTLSNARPSFRGKLTTGNTVGSSVVYIQTTAGSNPSTSSAQIVPDDALAIGDANSLGSYTATTSGTDEGTIYISETLAAGDADNNDEVISTASADLTVRFTTANAIPNGRFRILVPAAWDDSAAADGIPDDGTFDFTDGTPSVTCPSNATATYDFVSGAATASTTTIGSNQYHSFECAYSGTGAVGTAFDASSNDAITISSLINPAPKSDHSTGTADTHSIIVRHLDASLNVVDSTTVKVGTIEAVKVTATVEPSLTFEIIPVSSGGSACGFAGGTDVTTTAYSVPFGTVSISSFTDAAHTLSISTNAENGYSVTVKANDQLGKDSRTCVGDPTASTNAYCIQDSTGDDSSMTHTTSADWASSSNVGFAYSLHDNNSKVTEAFAYNESGRSFSARQFADNEQGESAQTIFSDTVPSSNDNLLVCYRIIPDVLNAAGDYENSLEYVATATF
ncbi:MAG: hypothetical protein GF390_02105 [Candidatus Pacebacteria bacterium]|nr:hypothetical protein [Candidatus Paceibacterota bacterium]